MNLFKYIFTTCLISCSISLVTNAQNVRKEFPSFSKRETKEINKDSLQIRAFANKIIIKNGIIGKKIEIYSLVGIQVKTFTIKNPNCEFDTGLAHGYYIIKIDKIVRKIALR